MKRLALEAKLINYCNICGEKYSYRYFDNHKSSLERFWTRYECKNCQISFHILRGYEFTYTIFGEYLIEIAYIEYSFKYKTLYFYLIDYNNLSISWNYPIIKLGASLKDALKHIKKYYDNLIFC